MFFLVKRGGFLCFKTHLLVLKDWSSISSSNSSPKPKKKLFSFGKKKKKKRLAPRRGGGGLSHHRPPSTFIFRPPGSFMTLGICMAKYLGRSHAQGRKAPTYRSQKQSLAGENVAFSFPEENQWDFLWAKICDSLPGKKKKNGKNTVRLWATGSPGRHQGGLLLLGSFSLRQTLILIELQDRGPNLGCGWRERRWAFCFDFCGARLPTTIKTKGPAYFCWFLRKKCVLSA